MNILLQTTIVYDADDWHAGRFSLLADELRAAGHTVTARNLEPAPDGADSVLPGLGESEYDQLWLMAVDTGQGLHDRDVEGIVAFREPGGGVVTARDHQDLGASLEHVHSRRTRAAGDRRPR